jgi:hypothetical protein
VTRKDFHCNSFNVNQKKINADNCDLNHLSLNVNLNYHYSNPNDLIYVKQSFGDIGLS